MNVMASMLLILSHYVIIFNEKVPIEHCECVRVFKNLMDPLVFDSSA